MNTPLKKAKEHDLNLSTQVVDESENDDTTPVVRYEITSYGADYVVSDFVSRLQRSDIIIPSFQRDYVWRLPEASRFVESILLGLPVLTSRSICPLPRRALPPAKFFTAAPVRRAALSRT